MARRPIWLWPNLLSLDAPLVALGWFMVFREIWLVRYHYSTLPWLLVVVVWCIYVADRLIDERMAEMGSGRDTARHEFHRKYRKPFTFALLFGVVASIVLLNLQARGLWTHGVFVLVPVVAYFSISFFDGGQGVSYLKNVLAGLSFAYGTAVGVHLHSQESHILHLLLSPEVLFFAALCMLNMTSIDHWEASRDTDNPEDKEIYKLVLTVLLFILFAFALVMRGVAEKHSLPIQEAFYTAIMVGAGAHALLNLLRSRFSLNALRVLADVAMLLPLPVFYSMLPNVG